MKSSYYTIPYYTILYYSILYYSILFYSILFYSIVLYSIQFYTITSWHVMQLFKPSHLIQFDITGLNCHDNLNIRDKRRIIIDRRWGCAVVYHSVPVQSSNIPPMHRGHLDTSTVVCAGGSSYEVATMGARGWTDVPLRDRGRNRGRRILFSGRMGERRGCQSNRRGRGWSGAIAN